MDEQLVATIAEIIKQEVSKHPNTLFSRQAFQMTVENQLEPMINQALTHLVDQGVICNLACSGNYEQAVYCLTADHGGNEAHAQQSLELISRITHRT